MSWSIGEVARHSGVSTRTLRHYDAIGLLHPAWTADGGQRFYEREQLLRLQRILLLREMGLGLDSIAGVLTAGDVDTSLDVLRRHHAWLLAERDRLDQMLLTVARTMTTLEEEGDMPIEQMFAGFEHNPYEDEARRRWGDAAVDDSKARLQNLPPGQAALARNGFANVMRRITELRDAGANPDSDATLEAVDDHYEWLNRFWTPNAAAYRGLADMYLDDERFRRNIGRGDDGLVEYLREAMHAYAERNLT